MDGNIIQDLFMQMWEGNLIAWLAFVAIIIAVGLFGLFIVLWWKMPQPAKKLFMNNLRGHRPTVADAYDNNQLIFETPRIFREGILHDKHSGWHFVPRLTKEADTLLNEAEREIVNKTFNIQGASGQFYLAYSGKGTIVNPELMAIMENPGLFGSTVKKKGNPDGYVYVNKQAWIKALQQTKDTFVQIKPVWITTLLDPRKIKNYLSKAYSKSQLLAQEIEIRNDARKEYGGVGSKGVMVLSAITLIAVIVVAVKVFGFI